MRINKKAEESVQYFGGKTLNVVLAIAVALLLVFVISKFVYGYINQKTELQKAGEQLQNILEKIDYVTNERVSDSLNIYPPEGWFLESDDGEDITDEQCLKETCLCICENVLCKDNRICKGFDYEVEVGDTYVQTNVVGPSAAVSEFPNTIRLDSFEKLRIKLISPASEMRYVVIQRE